MNENHRLTSRLYNEEKLRATCATATSIVGVLIAFGYTSYSGNYGTLRKACALYGIELPKQRDNKTQTTKRTYANTFTDNSTATGACVKRIIIRDSLLEKKCALCSIQGTWCEKTLVLHLDHINGKHTDNRLENLRFLCPNCHSQTPTFSGKRQRKLRAQYVDQSVLLQKKKKGNKK